MPDTQDRDRRVEADWRETQRQAGLHLVRIITVISLATVLGAAPYIIRLILGR